jgi:hypothetical protein
MLCDRAKLDGKTAQEPNRTPHNGTQSIPAEAVGRPRQGRLDVREFGSLILLRFGESNDHSDTMSNGPQEASITLAGALQEHSTIRAHHAASLLNAARLSPDVVLTLSQTGDFPDVNPLLAELRRLPRMVISDRLDAQDDMLVAGHSEVLDSQLSRPSGWLSRTDVPAMVTNAVPDRDSEHAFLRKIPASVPTQGESRLRTFNTAADYYIDRIVPLLIDRQTVLLIADVDSLRALRVTLDDDHDEIVNKVDIPIAQPLVYTFDRDLRPADSNGHYL